MERVRSSSDRRLSLTRVTAKGLKVVARLDRPIDALMNRYRTKLSLREFWELNRLLEALYADRVE